MAAAADMNALQQELEELRKKCQILERDKEQQTLLFEERKAKFKDVYQGKEKLISEQSATIDLLENKIKDNEDTISAMQVEIEDIKMIASVSENTKQEAVEQLNKRHQDEIESLRKAMEDSNEESQKEMMRQFDWQKRQWDRKIGMLNSEKENIETELEELKKRSRSNTTLSEEDELEESMKKAHAEAENLKSVIVPLEQEIAKLKEELQTSRQQLNESKKTVFMLNQKLKDAEVQPLAEVKQPTSNEVERETEDLHQQKNSAEENERLQQSLKNVRTRYEVEKAEHAVLKQTWLAANDQFLESQRLLMRDNSITEGVLSEDQRRQVKMLKLKAQANEARESSAKSPTSSLALLKKKTEKFKEAVADSISMKSESDSDSQSFGSFQDFQDLGESVQSQTLLSATLAGKGSDSIAMTLPTSEIDGSRIVPGPNQKVVDETEWNETLRELNILRRRKVPRQQSGDEPRSRRYTDLFDDDAKMAQEIETLKRKINDLEEERERDMRKISSLEESIRCSAEDAQKQINELVGKLEDFEKLLASIKQKSAKRKAEDMNKLLELTKEKEKLGEDLATLKKERDRLADLKEKHHNELAKENVTMPKSLEGVRNLVNMYRQALAISRAEREQKETKLQNDIAFLQERLKAEQSMKDQLETSLASELHDARGEIISLQPLKSVKDDLEKSRRENENLQKLLEKNKTSVEAMRSKSNEIIKGLREKVLDEIKAKEDVQAKLAETKNRLHSMQSALETSETVQRDFVRLSQSLQVQLEHVREELGQENGSAETNSVRSLDMSGFALSEDQESGVPHQRNTPEHTDVKNGAKS